MNCSLSTRCVSIAVLLSTTVPLAAQSNYSAETLGSSSTMLQVRKAAASHGAWERGRLSSEISYLGGSGKAYELLANASTGSFPYAAYSVEVSPSVSTSGFVLSPTRRVVPTTSANLFANDVTKSYWLTTGNYSLSGNVLSTASLDLTFSRPMTQLRWEIYGKMQASAQGTMRLTSPFAGHLSYAANFGSQELDGDFRAVVGSWGGLTFRRSAAQLSLALAPLTLFGPRRYTTLLSRSSAALTIAPFMEIMF